MHSAVILDRFANWFCSQMWVWGWAERRGTRFAVRVCRLCVARGVGVSIGWAHLVGKLDLNDALIDHAARCEVRRHA